VFLCIQNLIGAVVKAASFYKEVKSEVKKVSWPSRKEAMSATALVMFMSALFGLFFLVVDSVINRVLQFLLGV
jgi:preprotein translocase subunit SecE